MRVIGAAGHVDHGKSTLIQALTGIDPDRLREEKERGMTIDLGFAWLRLPSGREVSIVDVPGHERFIKNMLAGVGGIDIALLVVAADEGVMPQTREHLAILDLLQLQAGAVAITKRDLVDGDWLELVTAEVAEVLAETTLKGARLIPVSSVTGEGLEDLQAELDRLLAADRPRRQTGWPRLPVDRVFTMPGFGTVVTGTLIDGELRVGQEVELQPAGLRARVRGLQSHRKRVEVASAGARVAVNLAGASTEQVARGDVLSAPGWLRPTRVVDVRLRVIPGAPRPLPHNAQVSFHSGAAEALGRVSLLDADALDPGQSGWAQVRLDRPLALARGDPFIVRLPAANLTIGGGTIVDDHPQRHRRFQDRTLERLAVLEGGTPAEQLVQALQAREPAELREVALRLGRPPEELAELVEQMLSAGTILELGGMRTPPPASAAQRGRAPVGAEAGRTAEGSRAGEGGPLLISAAGWQRLAERARAELAAYHRQHPLRRGMPREEVRARLGLDARHYPRVEQALLARAGLAEDGPVLRLADHHITLSPQEQAQVDQLLAALRAAGPSPPGRAELKAQHQASDELLQVLIDRGDLVEVSADLLYARETYERIVDRIRDLIRARGKLTVAEMRDEFATSRKFALALLEHLDARKITRRVGDERVLA